MKLALTKDKIKQTLELGTLLTGGIEYEIKGGTSDITWTGPKIPALVWGEILAFFQDTYNRTKSECQVRLYVNVQSLTWAAWAYPQENKSYMTAKEIDCPAAAEQRAQFPQSEGWEYMGTVHHHCAAPAFQSGTDRHNETAQDGLHITVGKMDEARYDIHARFYLCGCEFAPDLALFWDIGDPAKGMIPPEFWDGVARHQMTVKIVPGATFPQAWFDNLIDINPPPTPAHNGNGSAVSVPVVHNPTPTDITGMSPIKRRELAWAMVKRLAKDEKVKAKHLDNKMHSLLKDTVLGLIRRAAVTYQVSMTDVANEWNWEQSQAEMERKENKNAVPGRGGMGFHV